jgi:hypothetical protein
LFNSDDWLRGVMELLVIAYLMFSIVGEGGDVLELGRKMPGGCCAKLKYGLEQYLQSYYSFLDMLNIVLLFSAMVRLYREAQVVLSSRLTSLGCVFSVMSHGG